MEKAIIDFCKRTHQQIPKGRGAFARIVYESLALKYRMVNEHICMASGTKTKYINIVGGGSKNDLLNQFAANAVGVPVFAGPEEATAVGNAIVQAMGLGVIKNIKEAMSIISKAFRIREFKPVNIEKWDQAYERFSRICK